MFYYPNVLQRHSGCFSTIWLAATKGIRVSRKELLGVNVKKTCWDVLAYVTAQVPPPQPHLSKPRFSLYLSSQLQYGLVVVYHRQCGFLLEEIQQTIERLLRFKRCIHIDMAEADRMALDVADRLNMMEEAEGAQDPFFGLMDEEQLPSPYKIPPAGFVIAEHSLLLGAHSTPEQTAFRSPPAAITLTEREQVVLTTTECFEGDDLPEVTTQEIDLLMDQPDMFRAEGEELQRGEPEGVGSFMDQLKETMVATERDSAWTPDRESGRPADVPVDAVALETTPPQVAMPTPPSEASGKDGDRATESSCEQVVVCPVRKPAGARRRRLVFADPNVQISDRVMREQVAKPLVETLQLSEVLLDIQALKLPTSAQLFSAPCGPLLHADLLSRWKDQASLAARPEPREGEEEEEEEEEEGDGRESEQDKEILREERKRRKETSVDSGLQPADASSATDVILDVSKEDKSVSDVMTPVSRWSPHEEVLPAMEPIAEEVIEMPEAQTDAQSQDTVSWITSVLQRFGEVSFDSLLPPEANRSTAAHTLIKLLELLSAGQVALRQADAYGDIIVTARAAMESH